MSALQQVAETVICAAPWIPGYLFSWIARGGLQPASLTQTMLLSPGVKPLIGQNIQGSRATSVKGAESRIALGTSPGLPPGTLCQRWNQEGKKNDPAEGGEAAARGDNQVSRVNMKTPQHLHRCGFFLSFFLEFPLGSCKKADLQPKCLPLIVFPLIT